MGTFHFSACLFRFAFPPCSPCSPWFNLLLPWWAESRGIVLTTVIRIGDAMNYWLMKTEPDEFSIDDLKRRKTEPWSGVRNYQARNYMRDGMRKGDGVLFYHSSCAVPGVAGIAEVATSAYPDPTQFDPKSDYFDAGSSRDAPRWVMVDVRF